MSQRRAGRTYFPPFLSLTGTHLSTDFLSFHLSNLPSSVIQLLQTFPTRASHFHPCVDSPWGGSDQMSPSVRSSASVRQRHHHPPVASRMLKRFLSGVIKMSHSRTTKSFHREQFVRAVKKISLLPKTGFSYIHIDFNFSQRSCCHARRCRIYSKTSSERPGVSRR